MANIPVAIQLFAVRGECEKDLPATLKAVAEIGYVGVEPWGFSGEGTEWKGYSGADLRAMLDDNALSCCGMHLTTDALLGDNLQRTIDLNRTLGNRFLIIAMDQQRMSAVETIDELAGILNEASEKLQPEGMFTGYHAHGFDFVQFDGRTAWDILFSSTRDEVIMQMDVGNCAGGGGDPIAILNKFTGRARSVHLKDFGGGEGAVIGEGQADWEEIFRICETAHPTEWYVVEECGDEGLGFDIPRRSFEALRKMGKC